MDFVDVLADRRLQRELRRREAALRDADPNQRPTGHSEASPAPEPDEIEMQPLVPHRTPTTRERWECDFCGRTFHAYGQFLNHHCHER